MDFYNLEFADLQKTWNHPGTLGTLWRKEGLASVNLYCGRFFVDFLHTVVVHKTVQISLIPIQVHNDGPAVQVERGSRLRQDAAHGLPPAVLRPRNTQPLMIRTFSAEQAFYFCLSVAVSSVCVCVTITLSVSLFYFPIYILYILVYHFVFLHLFGILLLLKVCPWSNLFFVVFLFHELMIITLCKLYIFTRKNSYNCYQFWMEPATWYYITWTT